MRGCDRYARGSYRRIVAARLKGVAALEMVPGRTTRGSESVLAEALI